MENEWLSTWTWAGSADSLEGGPNAMALANERPVLCHRNTAWRFECVDRPVQPGKVRGLLGWHTHSLKYVNHAASTLDGYWETREALERSVEALESHVPVPEGLSEEEQRYLQPIGKKQAMYALAEQAGPLVDAVMDGSKSA